MENPPSAQRNIGSTNTRSSISRTASVDRINYNDQSTSIQSVQQLTQELAKVSATAYKLPWEVNKAKAIKGTPKIPTWAQERPFFTEFPFLHNNLRTLKEDKDAKIIASVPLSKLPSQLHEHRLMEDILTVMSGIEGTYIKFVEGKPTFNIDTELDSSLINLINRILPIAIHYMNIARYVEKHNGYESGLFTHAFCAAINSIIREYYLLIAQLESQLRKGDLTLQKFLFFIQPSLKTLQTLDNLTQEVFNHIGGDLLNLIYLKSTALSGDKQIQDLTHFLLQKTSLPFFEMLQKWIYHGIIEDNYNEFFIEEHEEFQKEKLNEDYNDDYWEKRYTLKQDYLPAFLNKLGNKILITGKYLNVIRECDGNDIKSTITELISFTTNEREYQDKVDVAFQFASKTLLDLLIHSKQLIPRLRSLKHYFFLDQGDFFVHFMDASFEELSKQVTDITPSKLDSLLELSLRTSISESDPFKDDLHCVLLPYTLLNHLLKIIHVVHGAVHVNSTLMKQQQQQQADQSKLNYSKVNGFDAFSFDFKVQFPVSLVISRKALTKYQLIFRFLFFCKYVERQLCKAWTQHQSMKELDLKIALATSYSMRQRMLQFVQNVEYYIMCEVLEPNWQSLEENIRKASSIDDILDCHDRFLDNCLHQCMLTDQRLVQVITRLMVTCTTFANFTDLYIRTLKVEDSGLNTSISSDSISKLDKETLDQQKQIRNQVIREQALKVAKDKSFQNTLGKFEVKFNGAMKQLIDLLQLQSFSKYQLANLAMRLDYSGYYALYFEKNPHLVGPTNLATPLSASKKD